jgi:DNA-binding response OmpR family regulator
MAKILVADDDAHMLRVLAMWLGRNGHEVLEATDGQNARAILAEHEVDLVVSDVNMPRVSGTELVRWVRTQKSQSLPMVVLSSRCDQSLIAADLKDCGVCVHPKPFSPSRLVMEIERLLSVGAAG